MDIERRLRDVLTLEDPGAGFTRNVMARVGHQASVPPNSSVIVLADVRGRRRGRRFLFSALVAMAVAASMLALIGGPAQDTSPLQASLVQAPDAASAVPAQGEPVVEPVVSEPPPGTLMVRLLWVEAPGNDAASHDRNVHFIQALISRLRAIPGLILVDAGNASADLDVRIQFGDDPMAAGSVQVDAGVPATLDELARLEAGNEQQRAEARLRKARALSRTSGLMASREAGFHTRVALANLDGSADELVATLQLQLFPVSDELERRLFATLSDPRATDRAKALNDLLTLAERRGNIAMADEATVRAGAELALSERRPRSRQIIWEWLLATKHAELASYLIQAMNAESDAGLRQWMLASLEADYSGDPQVRAALDSVVQGESRPSSQHTADVAVEIDPAKRLLEALRDPRLTDFERLEPVVALDAPESGAGQILLQLDEDSMRTLAGVIVRAARSSSASSTPSRCLSVLASSRSQAARDVLSDIVLHRTEGLPGADGEPTVELTMAAIKLGTVHFPGDEKVTEALRAAAQSPNPVVRVMARGELSGLDARAHKSQLQQEDPPK